jgi:hypothetical protein
MKIDSDAISTLMIWARNQAPVIRWNEGVNQNTAEAERRLVRLEIAAEPNHFEYGHYQHRIDVGDRVVARVYLAEPRCRHLASVGPPMILPPSIPCECGPLAERKVD